MKKCIIAWLLILTMSIGTCAVHADDEKVHLVFATYTYEFEQGKKLQAALDGFYELYPNVEVEFVVFSTENHLQKLLSMAMTQSSEWDVTFCGSDTGEYASAGAFECLTPWLQKSGIDLMDSEKFLSNSIKATSLVGGDYYALPFEADTRAAVYNMAVFKNLGLTEADIPKTMDEMWALAEYAKEKIPTLNPVGMQFADWLNVIYQLPFFLWGNGGDFIQWHEADQRFHASLDNELGVQYVKDIRRVGALNNYGDAITTWDMQAMFKAFAADQTLFMWTGPWFYTESFWGDQYEDACNKAVWAPIPAGTDHSASSMGGQALGMNAYSKHKEEAWALMTYIYNTPELHAALTTGGLPIMVESYEYPPYSENVYYDTFMEQLKTAQPVVDVRCPVSSALAKAMYNPIQEIMLGNDGLTDGEAAKWLDDVLEEVLDTYYQ